MSDWVAQQLGDAASAHGRGDEGAVQEARAKLTQLVDRLERQRGASSTDDRKQQPPQPAATEVLPTASAEVPGGRVDRVNFSLTAPPTVRAGSSFSLSVWAFLEEQLQSVLEMSRAGLARDPIVAPAERPAMLERGARLSVLLEVDRMSVEPREKPLLWEGEIASAGFQVRVPRETDEGERSGRAVIYAGAEIASIYFTVTVADAPADAEALPSEVRRHRRAFASYASKDRNEVLGRIQGIQSEAPDINIFFDRLSIPTGEKWRKVIGNEILTRDVLYLFWSRNAAQSDYVDWEWRLAYEKRGEDFISPIPLESPDVAPPPKELSEMHFDHWSLAYQRNAEGSAM